MPESPTPLYHYAQHNTQGWVIDYDTLPVSLIVLPDTNLYTLYEGQCPEGSTPPPPIIIE